jgi:hypothetical protein
MIDTVILPWRGEFGQMLMTHVRWVQSLPGNKVVCCRDGDQPLFPSAKEFFHDWEGLPDHLRTPAYMRGDENQEYLARLTRKLKERWPTAAIRTPLDGVKPQRYQASVAHDFKPVPRCPAPPTFPQVLVAPRYRQHGQHRNFAHWEEVTQRLVRLGLSVGLLGAKETSTDSEAVPTRNKAWMKPDNLSTTLWWMQRAKLVLATDSAMAHLAVLAQAPLKVIYAEPGVEAGKPEWPWALPHMKAHAKAHCEAILHGWDDPSHVVDVVAGYLAP